MTKVACFAKKKLKHDSDTPMFKMLKSIYWCRFPRMKCVCVEASGYERLNENFLDYQIVSEDKDNATNEKEEEMVFYNDDGSYQTVIVERNLCASDLCQLLALKNRVSKSVNWSIVEHWKEYGLERSFEDHEYVLEASRDMRGYSRHAQFRYVFRKDYRKYEFFHNPQFFPSDMLNVTKEDFPHLTNFNENYLQNLVLQEGKSPVVFSQVWIKDQQKQAWGKAFLLLREKKLYLSYKIQVLAKFLRAAKIRETSISESDINGLNFFAELSNYHVYTTLNAKNQFRAPTEWGICLRPSGVDTEDETPDLKCIACDSERVRSCWLTAMRLAKYGKQLRENYRAFKNKQTESINPKDYNSYTVPNESVRSRVAMDFTGSVGRIVEDPKEAKAIAVAEGYSWKRRWRPPCRPPPNSGYPQGLESGVHITQPWFHSGMSRDQATALVTKHGTVDGVFLVRESRSNPGAFVLTYKCGGKVLHAQITPILDPVREAHVFSLDSGVTKFYDLLQLVEFYQLNAGCLPTRLTHYVVQNCSPVNSSTNPTTKMTVSGSI
ncbi:growth factor receptor-bound protein 14-like isoform X2 [Tribolium madens]|uniref:growth factor receptor-bound protein 14-like isoform X2 n=1 Tax=Tribolium madens TaxID=41895 RepID=UPI001CF744BD|nr:growth factor receptor-bound protein 14-like isoform X2 [Tribolium madens]